MILKGASTGSRRVRRGGSWGYSAQGCRSAYRSCNTPSFRDGNLGFRVVAVRKKDIFTNSIGMKFRKISAGSFKMGSPSNETGRGSDEGPQRTVKLTKSFYMGIYEVTQQEYKKTY